MGKLKKSESKVADALTQVESLESHFAQAKQDLEAARQDRDAHAKSVQEASDLVSKAELRQKEEAESKSKSPPATAPSKDDAGDSVGKRSLDEADAVWHKVKEQIVEQLAAGKLDPSVIGQLAVDAVKESQEVETNKRQRSADGAIPAMQVDQTSSPSTAAVGVSG